MDTYVINPSGQQSLRGFPFMTSAVGGGEGGSPKRRRKEQNQLICDSDGGGGEIEDVLYVSPFVSCRVAC